MIHLIEGIRMRHACDWKRKKTNRIFNPKNCLQLENDSEDA